MNIFISIDTLLICFVLVVCMAGFIAMMDLVQAFSPAKWLKNKWRSWYG